MKQVQKVGVILYWIQKGKNKYVTALCISIMLVHFNHTNFDEPKGMKKMYTNVTLKPGVGNTIVQSDLAFRSREKADAAEKEEDKRKNVVDEKTEAMMAV